MAAALNLTEPGFLRTLERLALVSKRAYAGAQAGQKRSTKRGVSVEFADYRDYVPGDDLRYVDWNIYGRLDRLLVKLFVEEEDLRVYLVCDRSASMGFGEPSKFDHARRLTAALAYIGLSGLDRVEVTAFGGELDRGLPPLRGKGNAARIFDYLESLDVDGKTDFTRSLARFAHAHPKPGLCVVISDFLAPGGYQTGLRALLARRYDVVALQVLTAEELRPSLVGDVRLIDSETGEARELTVSDSLLRRYRERAERHGAELRAFCTQRGVSYLRCTTDEPVGQLLGAALRRMGLVR